MSNEEETDEDESETSSDSGNMEPENKRVSTDSEDSEAGDDGHSNIIIMGGAQNINKKVQNSARDAMGPNCNEKNTIYQSLNKGGMDIKSRGTRKITFSSKETGSSKQYDSNSQYDEYNEGDTSDEEVSVYFKAIIITLFLLLYN